MNKIEINKSEETNKINFVIRLFKGDISLAITYWVFGALIGGVGARIILAIIEFNYLNLAVAKSGWILLQSVYWSIIAYSVFILISIWRSASKYKGDFIWTVLAKIAVILNVLLFVNNLWMSNDTEYALNEEVRIINKSLPTMVDSGTRLNYVSIQNGNIFYNYTLVNMLAADLDLERVNAVIQPQLKTGACETKETRTLINEGRSMNYIYLDKNRSPAFKVIVNRSDCF